MIGDRTVDDTSDLRHLGEAPRNMLAWADALSALEELERLRIPTIVLKSLPQVEDLYGDARGRRSGDVDLLVHREDALATLTAIRSLGWDILADRWWDVLSRRRGAASAATARPWELIRLLPGRGSIIDVHTDSMDMWPRPPLDPGIWERATPVERDGVSFLVLSPEDRLLFLCWHFFQHAIPSGFDWTKLQDIQLALSQHDMDIPYLRRRARSTGLTIFLHLGCDIAQRRSPTPLELGWRSGVPVAHGRRYRLVRGLYLHNPDALSRRARHVLWLLSHDRPRTVGRIWRDTLVPSREMVAVDYTGSWPSWPQYVATLAGVYGHRLRETFRD
jgi:hypothetical protein